MRRLLIISAVLSLMLLCSCSKEKLNTENDSIIALTPSMDKERVLTRASLYTNEDNLKEDLFHTNVYLSGTDQTYFSSDVKYNGQDWLFYEQDGGTYKNYYWPPEHSLDFFAHAPTSNGYVEVDYSSNPPTFKATMPLTNTGNTVHQENMKEFMYAYTSNKGKSDGPVPLEFSHPFAAIAFKVSQSHTELTVNSISIKDIAYAGTFSFEKETPTEAGWQLENTTGDLTLTVDKTIPGNVDFGEMLCGPYLVMPQVNATDSKNVVIEFTWHGIAENHTNWTPVEGKDDTYIMSGRISNNWDAGTRYTYSLDLGSNAPDVLFEVSVTKWEYVYEHEFEIE